MTDERDDRQQGAPEPAGGHWLYRRRTLNGLFWGLVLLSAGLGLADLFYRRHTVFGFEEIPAIYGIYGFVCFFGIVLSGWWLRKLVMRDEDYYDR